MDNRGPAPRAYLVESIPLGMEDLRQTDGVAYTEFVLKRHVERARREIDLVAMYWHLLPDLESAEEEGFSKDQLKTLGADYGRLLYEALAKAAGRGVLIRIVQSPGFAEGPQESDRLAQSYPETLQVRQLDMTEWYGGGIMHQKMWLFDRQHAYIGSANMDWRALSQVKELGVMIEHSQEIAADAGRQFDLLWHLSAVAPSTNTAFDYDVGIERVVPGWSSLVPPGSRQSPPWSQLEFQSVYNVTKPLNVALNGEPGDVYISGSPGEFCASGRTSDLDGILDTIYSATQSICISVMDFAPKGLLADAYDEATGKWMIRGKAAAPLWWPVIVDALMYAAMTNCVHVRLLVSQWWYSSPTMLSYLQGLAVSAEAWSTDHSTAGGRLEIKRFLVPGWDQVSGPERAYPGHSRVNHAKYIVTESRLNIGTSNLSWSYFACSVGASFNSTHQLLVDKLQELFDRDWESPYAVWLD